MFGHALALFGFLGLRVKQTDNAIRIAHRRDFRVGHNHGDIGMLHGENSAPFDAGRAVANDPVEFAAQIINDARHAPFRQCVLVPRL